MSNNDTIGCAFSYREDGYDNWRCESAGECMFLIPSAVSCNNHYGEGPIPYLTEVNERKERLKIIRNTMLSDKENIGAIESFRTTFPNQYRIMTDARIKSDDPITMHDIYKHNRIDVIEKMFDYEEEFDNLEEKLLKDSLTQQ